MQELIDDLYPFTTLLDCAHEQNAVGIVNKRAWLQWPTKWHYYDARGLYPSI